MSAKQKEVLKWLQETFGDNQIPCFEKNEDNIESIYKMMNSYKEVLQDFGDAKSFSAEALKTYENYVQEKQKILQIFDFPNFLQPQERKIIDAICNLCYEMNLESPASVNIISGIHLLEEQSSEVNTVLAKEKRRTKNLLKLSQNTAKNLEELKIISDQAVQMEMQKENDIKSEETKSKFCRKKDEHYNYKVQQLESQLSLIGYEEDLSHQSLSLKIKELKDLEKQYEVAKNTLDSYTLPPDMALALIEVEKSRQQLSMCMQQIAHNYENSS